MSGRNCWRPGAGTSEDSIGCHDTGDVGETPPAEGLPFHREPPTLIVREADAFGTVCRARDSVLLEQVLNNVLLLSIAPTGEEQER